MAVPRRMISGARAIGALCRQLTLRHHSQSHVATWRISASVGREISGRWRIAAKLGRFEH